MYQARLLVVDDEPDFAALIRRVAEDCGYETRGLSAPLKFIQEVRDWAPHLIVLDLQMPEVDGVELLRSLANIGHKGKIMLISGFDMRLLDSVRHLALGLGLDVTAALTKPIRVAELSRLLRAAQSMAAPITAADIADGLDNDEFVLTYQPLMDMRERRLIGAEALIRWQHPGRGLLTPDAFLSIAEQAPVIDELSDWVFQAALSQAGTWRREGLETRIAVNVSARNLHNLVLPDRVAELCRAYGVPPQSLTVELTETATMQDAARIVDVLARMRLKGFGLALDDFGTGYSSLVQLRRLPFTELKIDKSFVADLIESNESAVIAKTIIDMAHNLGLEPVAEGVESEQAAERLLSLGCWRIQGYWIGRPLSADSFRSLFLSNGSPMQRPTSRSDAQD